MTLLQISFEREPQLWWLLAVLIGCVILLIVLIWHYFAPWKLFDYDTKDSRYCKRCAAHQQRVITHYMYNLNVLVPDGDTHWVETETGTKPNCRCRRHAQKSVTHV